MSENPPQNDWRDASEADPAIAAVSRSVVPVYALPRTTGKPIHFGSAVLATVAGRRICLTAEHVITQVAEVGDLAIASSGKITPLYIDAIAGSEEADVAFIPATPRNLASFGDSPFLTEEEVGDVEMADGDDFAKVLGSIHSLMGFVIARKYFRYKPDGKKFHNASLNVQGSLAFVRQYTAEELPEVHVLFDYDKQLKMDGKWSTGPDPHGASGGAIFRHARHEPFGTQLVAVPHTYVKKRSVIRCTRMSYVNWLVRTAIGKYPDRFE